MFQLGKTWSFDCGTHQPNDRKEQKYFGFHCHRYGSASAQTPACSAKSSTLPYFKNFPGSVWGTGRSGVGHLDPKSRSEYNTASDGRVEKPISSGDTILYDCSDRGFAWQASVRAEMEDSFEIDLPSSRVKYMLGKISAIITTDGMSTIYWFQLIGDVSLRLRCPNPFV